jgi:hypothetical protein
MAVFKTRPLTLLTCVNGVRRGGNLGPHSAPPVSRAAGYEVEETKRVQAVQGPSEPSQTR